MKTNFRQSLSILTLCLFYLGCAAYRGAPPVELESDDVLIQPFVETLGGTNATIVWETDGAMYGWLEFAPKGTVPTPRRTEEAGTLHTLSFTNLTPNVIYRYHLAGRPDPFREFRTFSPNRTSYSFAALGDNRTYPDKFEKVTTAAARHDVDFFIHTGDVVADGIEHDDWYDEWFEPGHAMFRRAPVLIAWGNHGHPWDRESWLHTFYRNRSQFHGKAYFTYCHGPVRFIHVNLYEPFDPNSDQYKWLEETLASNRLPFTVVAFHVSPITGGSHATGDDVKNVRKFIVPLLLRYNVNLALTGHDHVYDRGEYGGTTFVVTGGAGAPLREPRLYLNPFSVISTSCLNYVICEVDNTNFTVTAYTVDDEVIDRFAVAPRTRAERPADAIASFRPPWKDYVRSDMYDWDIYVRNFTTNWIAGVVNVDAPEQVVIEPARRRTFFMRNDEQTRDLPFRAWVSSAEPGIYPLKVSVCVNGVTNTMACNLEKLGAEPVRIKWTFDSPADSLQCTNIPVTIADGMATAESVSNEVPRFFASFELPEPASSRDVSYYRMRLSGTNGFTYSRIRWLCLDESGKTNDVDEYITVPINGLWYTHTFFIGGREKWHGKPIGVSVKSVCDPNITVELEDVRLCAPPEGRVIGER